jgi:predicted Zn-dependent protease
MPIGNWARPRRDCAVDAPFLAIVISRRFAGSAQCKRQCPVGLSQIEESVMFSFFSPLPKRAVHIFVVLCFAPLAGCGSPEERAQGYYERGMALIEKKDDLNARLEFLNAVKYKSDKIEAWRALAGIEERTKNPRSLFQDLRRIVELDPKDVDARIKLGRIMFASGAADAALKLIDAGGKDAEQRADFHTLRSAILMRTNDAAGGVREAESAVGIEPANIEAKLLLASEKLSRGDADGAMQLLGKMPADQKEDPRISLIRIQIFGKKGDLPQAESLLKKLIADQPQQTALRGQLVQLYVAQRRFDDAEKELRAIAAAKPADSNAELDVVRFLMGAKGVNAGKDELLAKIKAGGDVFAYQMALADVEFAQGNVAESTRLLQDLISAASSAEHTVAAQIKLAEMHVTKQNFAAAEPLIADILAKDRRNTGGLRLRAAIRIEQGQLENAIADLREALADQPKSPPLLLLMATAYDRNGKPELADRQYADALKASGLDPAVGLRYVAFLQRRGSVAQADDVLTEVANSNPKNIEILSNLANIRLGRQNWAGALTIAEAIRGVGNDAGVADQIKAAALAGQNKIDASVAVLESAHAEAPDAVAPVTSLVAAYGRSGKLDKAELLLRDELKKFPANAQLLVLMGQTQLAENKPEDAVKSFNAAISAQPKNDIGYTALSAMYVRQKNTDGAMKVLEAGLKEQPNSLSLKLSSAGLLIGKDNDAAIGAYEAILKDQPNSLVAINNVVSLLLDSRSDKPSLERAYALADKLKDSNVPQFEDTLGWAQYKRGNASQAVTILEDAAKKLPNLAAVRYHLGQSYVAAGEAAKAAEQFKAAFNLEPDGTDLKEKIRTAMR